MWDAEPIPFTCHLEIVLLESRDLQYTISNQIFLNKSFLI